MLEVIYYSTLVSFTAVIFANVRFSDLFHRSALSIKRPEKLNFWAFKNASNRGRVLKKFWKRNGKRDKGKKKHLVDWLSQSWHDSERKKSISRQGICTQLQFETQQKMSTQVKTHQIILRKDLQVLRHTTKPVEIPVIVNLNVQRLLMPTRNRVLQVRHLLHTPLIPEFVLFKPAHRYFTRTNKLSLCNGYVWLQ